MQFNFIPITICLQMQMVNHVWPCMSKHHVFYEVGEETSLGLDSSVTKNKVVLPKKVTTQIEMISSLLIYLYISFYNRLPIGLCKP